MRLFSVALLWTKINRSHKTYKQIFLFLSGRRQRGLQIPVVIVNTPQAAASFARPFCCQNTTYSSVHKLPDFAELAKVAGNRRRRKGGSFVLFEKKTFVICFHFVSQSADTEDGRGVWNSSDLGVDHLHLICHHSGKSSAIRRRCKSWNLTVLLGRQRSFYPDKKARRTLKLSSVRFELLISTQRFGLLILWLARFCWSTGIWNRKRKPFSQAKQPINRYIAVARI